MTQEELKSEAEKLYPVNNTGAMFMPNRDEVNNSYKQEGFIAGATSDATKQYWYEQFEKQKLEFAIEQYTIIMGNENCPFPLFTFCKEKIKELEQKQQEL